MGANYILETVYLSLTDLNTDAFIRYTFPRLLVRATYSLLIVCLDMPSVEKLISDSFSSPFVRITHVESIVSPFEYDQFIERKV